MIAEDDVADVFSQFAWHLTMERLKRGLWFCRGWPWALSRMLCSGEGGKKAWQQFKKDKVNFEQLQKLPDKNEAARDMLKRHIFNKVSVVQLSMAAEDSRGECSEWLSDLLGVLRSHTRIAVPSRLIEDMIGTMKSTKTSKRGNKYSRPQRGMGMVIRKKVVDGRHGWTAPCPELPVGGKTTKLSRQAFEAQAANRSLNFNEIVGTVAAAPYYSPKPEMFAHNVSDLASIDAAAAAGDINKVAGCWLGEVAAVDHRLLVGVPHSTGDASRMQWYHVLTYYPRSSILAWPGSLNDAGGYKVFEHSAEVLEPVLLALFDFSGVLACSFVWRSWLWQAKKSPATMTQAVRIAPVVEHGPRPILEVMALKAFWSMTRTQVVAFAKLRDVAIPDSANLCDTLMAAVQGLLGVEPDDALKIISQRLAVNDLPTTWADEVLAVDEAAQVLERSDAELVQTEQRDMMRKAEEGKAFVQAYRQRKFDVRAEAAARKGNRRPKKQVSAGAKGSPGEHRAVEC